jgi:hypothetical protein
MLPSSFFSFFFFFFFQHMGIAAGDDGHEVAAAVQYVIS